MLYPLILKLGPVSFTAYGLCLSLAMLLGVFLFWRNARSEGFDESRLLDLSLVSLLAGFFGARLVFVLANFTVFSSDFGNVLRSFNTGLSWFGGLIFGAAASVVFCRLVGWSVYKLFDLAASALALGQVLGGIGWVLAGLAFPTAEEETMAYLLIFFLLALIAKEAKPRLPVSLKIRTGFLGFLWLFLSGAVRFVAEFYRVESWGSGFSVSQILAGLVMLGGGLVLFLRFGADLGAVLFWFRGRLAGAQKNGLSGIEVNLSGLKSWLSREKGEISKEQGQLHERDLFFQPGRTEDNAEIGDEAQELISNEYARTMASFLERFGEQINRALGRMRHGGYGVCERCGREISPDRLEAYPAATLCLECEQQKEKRSTPPPTQ